jgi:glycosyltransferase involved in cell wall biosynthesis
LTGSSIDAGSKILEPEFPRSESMWAESATSRQPATPRTGGTSAGNLRLVLVTPARNEAQFIELTIQSVIAQTIRPSKWIIVSDGSTDGTDEIVKKYASPHPWIELIRMPERRERHFAGKVQAFNAALANLADAPYDVIANVDADISFDEEYIEFLLTRFAENPRLGVAGTPFRDESVQYNYSIVSSQHVSGCCQFFRRKCFEEIGGYMPIKTGGIDLLAVISARMKGWETHAFQEKSCIHHRNLGSAKHGAFKAAFLGGRADYILGCDPLWQTLRSAYRMITASPVVLNGMLTLGGYVWAWLSRTKKAAPDELVRFRRSEERQRLLAFLRRPPTVFGRKGESRANDSIQGQA